MTQIPVVELMIRSMGEEIRSAVMLRHADIERLVEQGVERAIANIGEAIIEEAAKIAAQKVHEEVKHYLTWGVGGEAIRAAVHYALAPLTAMLQTTPVPGTAEGDHV
jgi:hypothetical protein